MNTTLPILPMEIVNKILIMRPTHPIAKLFEEDKNVKMWKKYFRIRWFFYAFYFKSYYVINSKISKKISIILYSMGYETEIINEKECGCHTIIIIIKLY